MNAALSVSEETTLLNYEQLKYGNSIDFDVCYFSLTRKTH